MQEMRVQSLGQEDPWNSKWQPTLVFLPGKFHGQRSLEGYSPWGHKESHDWVTEYIHTDTHSNNYLYWTLTIGQDLKQITSSNHLDWCLCEFVKVVQSCPILCNPMDYTVHGILQPRILEWVALPFSRRSSQPRDRIQVSCIVGKFFTSWATREARGLLRTSLVAHMVNNLPANTGNLRSIPGSGRFFGEGNDNPLQWRIPGHAWRILWAEEPGGLQSMGSQRVTRLSDWVHTHRHTQ